MDTARPALAVDIGGTKLAAGVIEPNGRLIAWEQTPTRRDLDAEQLWRTLDGLISRALDAAKVRGPQALAGVGCGCGGPMEWPAGLVSPLNIPAWRAFPLRGRLEERFAGMPVRVHNDAICMAAGEHWRGAGRGASNMLGMVVSTGVGGGLILERRLIEGTSGNAGHIGHVVVYPDDGPPCVCGGIGCLEAIARGPALVTWAQGQGWRPGQADATAKDLAGDGAAGHPVGVAAMRRAGKALGIAIASAMYLCDLEVVSVGGGLSQAGALLFGPLQEALRAHTRMDFTKRVRVVPAALGQGAGLVGAAALIFAADRYWSGGAGPVTTTSAQGRRRLPGRRAGLRRAGLRRAGLRRGGRPAARGRPRADLQPARRQSADQPFPERTVRGRSRPPEVRDSRGAPARARWPRTAP